MSKLFYDHLLVLEEVEIHIKNMDASKEEKEELWNLVDGVVRTRVMDVILTKLPKEHHEDFLEKLSLFPHDERLMEYLKEKVEGIDKEIQEEVKKLASEVIKG